MILNVHYVQRNHPALSFDIDLDKCPELLYKTRQGAYMDSLYIDEHFGMMSFIYIAPSVVWGYNESCLISDPIQFTYYMRFVKRHMPQAATNAPK